MAGEVGPELCSVSAVAPEMLGVLAFIIISRIGKKMDFWYHKLYLSI